MSWSSRPAGTDAVMIRTQRYSTALHSYGRANHYQVTAGGASKKFSAMTNGRAYKVVVAFHNRYGYSAWSTLHTVSPGAVPSIGGSPRYLVWKNSAYVHYGWNRSRDNGSPITRVHAKNGFGWDAWSSPRIIRR